MGAPDGLEVEESVPQAAPLQPDPERFQVTPLFCGSFATVAVMVCACPASTACVCGEMLTVIAGRVTVIMTLADLVGSAMEVAVSVTVIGFESGAGAAYVIGTPETLDVLESVPQVAPLHPAPESVQLTPLFCTSFWIVAVKLCELCELSASNVAVDGATLTLNVTGAAMTVIVATETFVPSDTAVAVRLTVDGFGGDAGAL